jgi:predicted nucleic acid-binding Zn ribbon protein
MPEVKNKSWKDSLKSRKYDEHKHCIVCGRAVPMDRDFCTQECKEKYSSADKKKGRKNWVQIAVLGVVMVVVIFLGPTLLELF